jgi:acetyl-CoA carboxylase biotin carboxyl carrier protein
MDLSELRKLVQLMLRADLSELELDDKNSGQRVHLKRDTGRQRSDVMGLGGMMQVMPSPPMGQTGPGAGGSGIAQPSPAPAAGATPAGPPPGTEVFKSPIVGTFYRSASPDAEPFVTAGSRFAEGSVLCIIEAMKVMNEIRAEFAGEVVEVVLMVRVLDVRQEVAPAAHQMEPPAQQVPRRAHLGRVDVGLGQVPASQQVGDLEGIDAVVLGLAAVDGLHVEGVAEDEGDPFPPAEVREPVPGEDALGGDDEVFAVGRDGGQEGLGTAAQVLVEEDLALAIEDAQVHRLRVEVDPAVVGVALRVESHGSLLKRTVVSCPSSLRRVA